MDILLKNNTGNQTKDTLINGFVIRLKAFTNIFSEIQQSKGDKPEQNYLIIGQRGAGKTTLLYRLKYAIEDDPTLSDQIIPVMLHEEQYHLTELGNLWETVIEYLEENTVIKGLSQKATEQSHTEKYWEEKLYDLLERELNAQGKKIILFIENLDVLLKKFAKEGQQRLREVLSTSKTVRIVGSSTNYFEGILSYTDPFYEFFKIVQLGGLTKSETLKLLVKIAKQSNETEKIQQIVRRSTTRIEALRRLTGGNPRMIAYLYQIFLENVNGKAIKDLYRLLDDLTFLYKSEIDQLSAQQQKIIDVIARNWDAISVKEIAQCTKMESKHVSSVLNLLEKNQIIERITTKTKNNLYRLKDRFLNIWYLMRFGKKKDKENILWLVRFYDSWCDKSELSERVLHYINDLIGGKYDNTAIDMVNTFLSCKNVPALDKFKLLQTSKSTLPQELTKGLKLTEKDWFGTIETLVTSQKYDEAIATLGEKGDQGISYHLLAYLIYVNKGEYEVAATHLEWVYNDKKDGRTALMLGELYEMHLEEPDKAIKYFELALAKKQYESALRLGRIYEFLKEDEQKAIEYYQIAVSHDIKDAIMALGTLYYWNNNLEEAKRFCLLAIEKGYTKAYINLATLLEKEGKIDEAILNLKTAINKGEDYALISLGELYLFNKKPRKKAKELFVTALQKGTQGAHYALGKFLLKKEKNYLEAEKILLEGVNNADERSAHFLAHHYQDTQSFAKAEEMFVKAFDLGHLSSLLCLANSAFNAKLHNRKEFILNLFEEKMNPIDEPLTIIEYCKLLVWNERYQDSVVKLLESEQTFSKALNGTDEDYKESLLSALTSYFIRLAAKRQYKTIMQLFSFEGIDFKQILKPVHFAIMEILKEEFPSEYLKAGSEMTETIEEITKKIERVRELMS